MITIPLVPFTLQIPGVDTLKVQSIGSPSRQAVPDGQGGTVELTMQPIYYELERHHAELGTKTVENGNKSIPFATWILIQDFISGAPVPSNTIEHINGFFVQAGWPELVIPNPIPEPEA